MKKLILLFLFPILSLGQELTLNSDTKVYEYNHVKSFEKPVSEMISSFEKKMKELNYTDVIVSSESISGKSFFSVLIMGTTLQVFYITTIDFKENKYKLLINKFVVDDKRWSPIPLEDLKSNTKRWVKKINEKLPTIVSSIESPNKEW